MKRSHAIARLKAHEDEPRRADIMTRDSLHRSLRPGIEASALRVFR